MELLNMIASLSIEEQDILKEYIDKKIETEINKLRQEIKKEMDVTTGEKIRNDLSFMLSKAREMR